VSAIVVVEDDARVRTAICRGLERAGFVVWAFPDGRAAWSFLESTTRLPDLVITDLAMPHVTGPELLGRIEARYPGLPCAWMSLLARCDAVAGHPELANYPSIQKPCAPAEVVGAVGTLLHAAEW
jgi:DNA-binding NtrC family response regulator